MLFPQLQHELDDLAEAPDTYTQLMHHLVSVSEGTELPLTALLIFATSRRATAAAEAFCQTIASDNHLMAPAIIRMHLDHLLTLHAAREHEAGADQYTYRRLEGMQTRRMNNGRGKKMHDAELIASVVEVTGDEWIKERHQIYRELRPLQSARNAACEERGYLAVTDSRPVRALTMQHKLGSIVDQDQSQTVVYWMVVRRRSLAARSS